jgi:hypothetical protein
MIVDLAAMTNRYQVEDVFLAVEFLNHSRNTSPQSTFTATLQAVMWKPRRVAAYIGNLAFHQFARLVRKFEEHGAKLPRVNLW